MKTEKKVEKETEKKSEEKAKKEAEKKIEKKILLLNIFIVILVITGIVLYIVKSPEKIEGHKIYNMGDTIKTSLYEISVKDVTFSKQICTSPYHRTNEGHEEFFKPITEVGLEELDGAYPIHSNLYRPYYLNAQDGEILVTIEYTIKNISSDRISLETIDATSQFTLIYDKEYNFTNDLNDYNNTKRIYIEKTKKDSNGEEYKVWSNDDYFLNPLSEAVRVREYIQIPDTIMKDNASLVLKKEFKATTNMQIGTREPIYVKIR